ncbi:NAD(P)/FAD-dependent oxidoreductase [Roseomonas sp. 18066]|uniref:NAD(P)/FAD-dependent oxidoreductase n=1 Tax=Roseomonas sp. 18066 TaxID=2681412 RepID=UPI001356D8C1|nr:NAD(P)/FAD-dependent oxidoreductase [Roseomonas sp. 18066]
MTLPSDAPYDIAVIGAGVVGCAVFRDFSLSGLRVALLERGADILSGASKANSALLHTGFDAVPGSLESRLMQEGAARYRQIHAGMGLPLLPTGAVVVAWNEADAAALPGILQRGHANGVQDVRPMGVEELRAREPHLAPEARGAVWVPGESVIDAWSAPLGYALQGIAAGGRVLRNAGVRGGTRDAAGIWRLDTAAGPVAARIVVNCAGNQGDIIEAIARPSPFEIRPRKGQFVVLDKTAYRLATAIILPVPNERTKGVVISRTAFGNLLVGPTAEEQPDRERAATDTAALESLLAQGRRMIPALAQETVTTAYAGLRPATQFKDYQIEALPREGWISIGGIRSTGLTAALGISAHARRLYEAHFAALPAFEEPEGPVMPNLTEELPRLWQQPGREEIICHCEMVTRREIEAAFQGPLPAGDLGGLKRRSRCMMGRCQGFYCSRRVMEIAAPHLPDLVAPIGGAR